MTVTKLLEALEVTKREELKLQTEKKAADKKANRLIGREQEKQKAILEELDAVRAGRSDFLPFSDADWEEPEGDPTRAENV